MGRCEVQRVDVSAEESWILKATAGDGAEVKAETNTKLVPSYDTPSSGRAEYSSVRDLGSQVILSERQPVR